MTMQRHKTLLVCAILLLLGLSFILSPFVVSASAEEDNTDQIKYFGTAVACGKDNGYRQQAIKDDPHKGWTLGSFFVKGFSGVTQSKINAYNKDMPVYLKNAGDTVTFGFKLDQNIDKLNGNKKLKIADDKKVVQDCYVADPYVQGDFHKGVLIIVHTDANGKEKISTYRDFLKGKSVGANTEVQLFEEGDYRVILAYEIYRDDAFNFLRDWANPNGSWFDYKIEEYFSVRNGNCMIYPMDVQSGSELTNKSCSKAGFRVDLAKSNYLQLSVKKENLNSNKTDIVEDIRFNKIVSDGTKFVDEGKYTITAKNVYTNLTTEKVIYVGDNPIMICNATTGLSVPKINGYLQSGYTLSLDGTLKDSTGAVHSNYYANSYVESANGSNAETNVWMIVAIVSIVVIAVGGIVIVVKKNS